MKKQLELTAEEKKLVDDLAEIHAKDCIFTPDTRNLLPVESCIAMHVLLSAASFKIRNDKEKEHLVERRQLLKENKEKEYAELVQTYEENVKSKSQGIQMYIIEKYTI